VRRLRKLAIIGAGLIGGSFALALRRSGFAGPTTGYDRDRGSRDGGGWDRGYERDLDPYERTRRHDHPDDRAVPRPRSPHPVERDR